MPDFSQNAEYYDCLGEPLTFWSACYSSFLLKKEVCGERFSVHIPFETASELYEDLIVQTDDLHRLALWVEHPTECITVQTYVFRRFNTLGELISEDELFRCYIFDHA